jgi:hypothetical protein
MTDHDQDAPASPIKLYIPPRFLYIPGAAVTLGIALGLTRGGRRAARQFLAENAHAPPTTVKGWYMYNRTKNYKVMLGGLKGAGKESLRLGAVAVGWVALEELLKNSPFSMVGAGVGTSAIFAALYRLPLRTAGQTMLLGLVLGGSMEGLTVGRRRLEAQKSAGAEWSSEEE